MSTSQNPTFNRFGEYLEGGHGNYTTGTMQGAPNVPITGDFAIRGAGKYQYVRKRRTSGEIKIILPTLGPFTWIVGGYYQRNHGGYGLRASVDF